MDTSVRQGNMSSSESFKTRINKTTVSKTTSCMVNRMKDPISQVSLDWPYNSVILLIYAQLAVSILQIVISIEKSP